MQIFARGGEEEVERGRTREGGRPLALFPSPFADDDDDNAWLRARGREGGVCHVARRPHHPHKSRGPRCHAWGREGTERTDYDVIQGTAAAEEEEEGENMVFCGASASKSGDEPFSG